MTWGPQRDSGYDMPAFFVQLDAVTQEVSAAI
jgi:hypothetical protein